MKNIKYFILAIIVMISFSACTKVYKVGDKGPAGGIIFYDKGEYSQEWRYLEAAPADTEFETVWSDYPFHVEGTQSELGTGKSNTKVIVEVANYWRETIAAAQMCANLNIGKYSDWYLPSNDELDHMNQNLKMQNIGDFKDKIYWSSTQYYDDETSTWTQYFGTDEQGGLSKDNRFLVQAIRAF